MQSGQIRLFCLTLRIKNIHVLDLNDHQELKKFVLVTISLLILKYCIDDHLDQKFSYGSRKKVLSTSLLSKIVLYLSHSHSL